MPGYENFGKKIKKALNKKGKNKVKAMPYDPKKGKPKIKSGGPYKPKKGSNIMTPLKSKKKNK